MGKNYAVARVVQYTKASIGKAERHIERKNQNYENLNVDLSRAPMNVHYKSCGDQTYNTHLDQLVESGAVSLRGLKPDAKVFDEMIFDVNTAYFEEHGGYEYARQFYEEVFRFAENEYGSENIVSAVMHADELNSALTEELGRPVYHYHLHVVALPVVEKEIKWSKRCKDPELVGKVKEVIRQISHSKKWASQKVTDENGESHFIKSYSLLQDRFFEHMRTAGFEDFERGERGSTAQHLSVLEFKAKKETERLDALRTEQETAQETLDQLGLEQDQKEAELARIERKTQKAQDKLDGTVPVVQDAVAFARSNISYFENIVPEAGPMERAKSYREEKILPMIAKLRDKFLGLYRVVLDLRDKLEKLKARLSRAERDRDYFKEKCTSLQRDSDDLTLVREALGAEKLDNVIAQQREHKAAIEAERQKQPKRKEVIAIE